MRDWDEYDVIDESDPPYEPRSTVRQLVIRFVALVLLASFLGGLYVVFRGIEDILVVIGILLVVAAVASLAKKQRESENPYESDRRSDFDVH